MTFAELLAYKNATVTANQPQPPQPAAVSVVVDDGVDFFYLYLNYAVTDYRRHYAHVRNNNPSAWISCWMRDMDEFLEQYKIDKPDFAQTWSHAITN